MKPWERRLNKDQASDKKRKIRQALRPLKGKARNPELTLSVRPTSGLTATVRRPYDHSTLSFRRFKARRFLAGQQTLGYLI